MGGGQTLSGSRLGVGSILLHSHPPPQDERVLQAMGELLPPFQKHLTATGPSPARITACSRRWGSCSPAARSRSWGCTLRGCALPSRVSPRRSRCCAPRAAARTRSSRSATRPCSRTSPKATSTKSSIRATTSTHGAPRRRVKSRRSCASSATLSASVTSLRLSSPLLRSPPPTALADRVRPSRAISKATE